MCLRTFVLVQCVSWTLRTLKILPFGDRSLERCVPTPTLVLLVFSVVNQILIYFDVQEAFGVNRKLHDQLLAVASEEKV
jgi:hypothetical protein